MSRKSRGLSIVIPARNEVKTAPLSVNDCINVLETMDVPYEIIVVDDGSPDGTVDALGSFNCRCVINHGKKNGNGIALRLVFEASSYDTILMLDADYFHRAEDIPTLWNWFRKGYGLVVADRMIGGSDEYTFIRTIGNVFLTTAYLMSLNTQPQISRWRSNYWRIPNGLDLVLGKLAHINVLAKEAKQKV